MAKTNNHIYQNIKDNLINFRDANDLSGDIIAGALNIKPSTYRNYETGRSTPSIKTLLSMAKIFGVSVERLLGEPIITDNKVGSDHTVLDGENSIEMQSFSPLCSQGFDTYYNNEAKKSYLSELENTEKLVVMKYRQLNDEDKLKLDQILTDMIEKLMEDEENTQQNE